MNILFADDDSTSRDLMRRVIALAPGHQLTEVTDGEEAWELLDQPSRHFDLALLDVTMPRLDGIGVLERIRRNPRLNALPVILCTAMHDRRTVERAKALAVTHYIIKPYNREFVLEKLRAVAATLPNSDTVEDRAIVAQRLGVTVAEVRELIDKLLANVRAFVAKAEKASDAAEFAALSVSANGFRGASANLGLQGLGRELESLEKTYGKNFASPQRTQSPITPAEAANAVLRLKAELAKIDTALAESAPPSIAEVPVSPAPPVVSPPAVTSTEPAATSDAPATEPQA